jgi:hypothetical protein
MTYRQFLIEALATSVVHFSMGYVFARWALFPAPAF